MIRCSGLTLRRGQQVLLDQAEFVVHPGERVGLVGRNGAGKSSLFALLRHEIDQDAGSVDMPVGWRMASVMQEIHDTSTPAREFVIDGDTHLRLLQREREQTSSDNGTRIAELESELTDANAWSAPSRAEQLLAGLGFAPDQWMQPVSNFSGGWRMRIALARALMAPSELLLLDEPTNHLDLDAMLWLERWLAAYEGTVLVISHDTEFLDAVVQTILHVDQGKLVRYKGGYESFVLQRAERLRQARIAWERQTRETTRLQSFIDRFKAKASKAKQAQSRVKALARMEQLAPIHAEAGIDIRIPSPESMPDPLLVLEHMDAGYFSDQNERITILRDVNLMVRGGDRIGILGVNGAGKSTLVKTLAGLLPVMSGQRRASKGLEIGYFAQHQLDMLDLSSSPLQHLSRLAPQTREQELRNYLGGFGFGGDRVTDAVLPFSGGEKARLALALIVWQKPNLLLLDEPSNHLDVETREALTTALAEFGGSMLLVSHDRHLLRTTVDSFWIVADGHVHTFDGDLEDYRDWLAQRQQTIKNDPSTASSSPDRKQQKRLEAENRQRLSTLRKPIEAKLAKVEKEMDALEREISALDQKIADPDFYSDAFRAERATTMTRHGELSKRHSALEEQWLELQTELESLQA